ncbi:MAG: aminopeptidase P family protein, partial [Lachnospiraceae bacterium]|nr:aminopeptidase P family protein [Lachnospiraceae bacterium]
LRTGETLGMDGRTVSAAWVAGLKKIVSGKKGNLVTKKDLIGSIWQDRPEIVFHPAYCLSEKYTGESRKKKLERLRDWLKKRKNAGMVISSLDEIAWLLNIRGEDVLCNPVVLSYLFIDEKNCFLFAGRDVFSTEDRRALEADGVTLRTYEEIYRFVCSYPHEVNIFVDKRHTNAEIIGNFPQKTKIFDVPSPIVEWKSVKNRTEMEGERQVHILDGVAVTKFIYWLKKNIGKIKITECSAAEKLEDFRKEQADYRGPSFETISGYAEHGAIVHYQAAPETDLELREDNFLLVDSGGQYFGGTTDITRTIFLGKEASAEQRTHYTAVLRGNLNLCAAKFLYGCSGVALDYAARKPLWDMGLDFNHGTGHGVGCFLNVHERANAFRYKIAKEPGGNPVLEEGMVTSDEPGLYLEGRYGIRLENLILCVKREKNEYGQFMGFEPLTFVPFERKAIDITQMNEEERRLLNTYHRMVYEKLERFLEPEEREWLREECREL